MAMRQFLLFLSVILPICMYGQSWSGDTDKFELDGKYLMLNGSDEETETFYLEQPYTLPADVRDWQWEFSLYFKTKPTQSNYIDIQLAEGADILFHAGKRGHNGLYTFSVNKEEVAFTFEEFDYTDAELLVSISLTEGKHWRVALTLSDVFGQSEQQTQQIEAAIPLPTTTTFHVAITHTKTYPNDFGISNRITLSEEVPSLPEPEEPIEPEEPDSSDVELINIESIDDYGLKLYFSAPVNIDNASFYIEGVGIEGKEKLTNVAFKREDYSVELTFSPMVLETGEYQVTWEGIVDANGLPMADYEITIEITDDEDEEPELPTSTFNYQDIRINEVMANPKGLEPEIEYIELYNTLDKPVLLDGWVFDYRNGYGKYALDGITIAAKGYLVLYNSKYEWTLPEGTACPIDKFKQLANTGNALVLYHNREIIDQYTYPEAEEGKSQEYAPEGWHICSDERGGTPGEMNSDGIPEEEPEEPEDPEEPEEEEPEEEEPELPADSFDYQAIRINEVMADPTDFVPNTEYIELYNTLDKSVQLNGWTLKYGSTEIDLNDVTIRAHSYIVLFRTGDEEFDLPSYLTCALDKFPAQLANTGKALTLLYRDKTIDQYTYSKAKEGKSWEYAPEGWHICSDERGGTPGEMNSDGIPEEEPEEPEEPEEEEPEEEEPELPAESFDYQALRITEIMADPRGFEPETEYIELFNTLNRSIRLDGWTLVYNQSRVMKLRDISISPGSYIVLYDKDKTALSEENAYPVDNLYPLANGGEKGIELYDASGKKIDEYNYPAAKSGKSWEYGAEGWHISSAERGGTPGKANSDGTQEEEPDEENPEQNTPGKADYPAPEAGEIIINELLPEPFSGGSEYIELFNRSDHTLSLADVCISTRKKNGSLNTHYPLAEYNLPLEEGEYLLISKSISGVEAFYMLPANVNCLECKLPALSNTGSTLVLFRESDMEIIDEVNYSPKWHDASVKNRKGVALERINPNGDSQDEGNWTSAAASHGSGTPGEKNSQYRDISGKVTGNEPISIPIYQPSNGLYQMTYQLEEAGYSARGWVFDMNGRRVSTLAEGESLGTNGTLEWDGHGTDGSRLSPGIYIMYIELWNFSGSVYRQKSAFLVH